MKKVMVFGAFDIVHPGHLSFFKQARKHGNYLIVSVGRDSVVAKIKGKKPHYTEQERLDMVKQLRIVDKAFLGDKKDYYKHVLREKPDIICLGYDQDSLGVEKELAKHGFTPKIIRLKAHKPQHHKSGIIKKLL